MTVTGKQLYERNLIGATYQQLADEYGITRSAVSGRITRYKRSQDVMMLKSLAVACTIRTPKPGGALAKQDALMWAGQTRLDKHLNKLSKARRWGKLLFCGDLHLPYVDIRTVDLLVQIARDFEPDLIPAMNDGMDWAGYSRHEEHRSASQLSLEDNDVTTALAAYRTFVTLLQGAAPNALLFQLQGNHDEWLYKFARRQMGGAAEAFIYDALMLPFADMGIAMLSNGPQNTVKLSPGLKLHHGVSAAKLPSTIAKNTLEALAGQSTEEDAGTMYNVATAHVHRMHEVAMYGVTHWSTGCLCLPEASYMNRKPGWQQGVTLLHFDPTGRGVVGYNVRFLPRSGRLIAQWGGNEYQSSDKLVTSNA